MFKASGGKLGCGNTQRQTQDAQQICGNLGIGIEDAPPEAYEVPMRSTKSTRKMFSVACGTTHPATQPQPNQQERESAEIRHRAHIVVMCSVNRKTLVSSKVLVGLAHHPSSHPNHTPPTAQPARKRERRRNTIQCAYGGNVLGQPPSLVSFKLLACPGSNTQIQAASSPCSQSRALKRC